MDDRKAGREPREVACDWDSENISHLSRHSEAVKADLRAAMRERKTISLGDVMAQARRTKELPRVTIHLANEDIAMQPPGNWWMAEESVPNLHHASFSRRSSQRGRAERAD
ncbi:MAG: hypothetical protein EXQ52_05065 [Bryobacterales bacterium]|nr:hypothetical protein [Bryobacterales bacterium]